MLAKLFAFFGLKRARRWDAQAEAVRLASLLEYLEAADVSLEEMEYAFIEKFYSETMRAEYQKELRALRRKFGIRGCKLGLIDCAERGDGLMTEQFLTWKEEERTRGTKKRKTAEPMDFTPGRIFQNEQTTEQTT